MRSCEIGSVQPASNPLISRVITANRSTRLFVLIVLPLSEAYPPPPPKEKKIEAGGDRYQTPASVLAGWQEDFNALADEIYSDFNKEYGANYKFQLKK